MQYNGNKKWDSMYRRWLKQDFKNCLWRLRLVFRFDIQQIRKNRDLLAIFCINALACGWTVALPASLATAACRMCVLFCAWGPGSPGGQQVWLLPLLSSSAFLLLTLVFHNSLFSPPGIQRELKGNSVRWIMIYLYFFFISSGGKSSLAVTHRYEQCVKMESSRFTEQFQPYGDKEPHEE